MNFLTITGFEKGENGPVGNGFSTFKAQVNPTSIKIDNLLTLIIAEFDPVDSICN